MKQSVDAKQAVLNGLQERQTRLLSKYSLRGVLQLLTDELERLDDRADLLQRRYKTNSGDDGGDDDNASRKSAGMGDDDLDDLPSAEKKRSAGFGAAAAATPITPSPSSAVSVSASGKLDHTEFCRQYLKLRKLWHFRSALKERLIELYGRS